MQKKEQWRGSQVGGVSSCRSTLARSEVNPRWSATSVRSPEHFPDTAMAARDRKTTPSENDLSGLSLSESQRRQEGRGISPVVEDTPDHHGLETSIYVEDLEEWRRTASMRARGVSQTMRDVLTASQVRSRRAAVVKERTKLRYSD